MQERIQKVVAQSGHYSRRQVEDLIRRGRVKVNGIVLKELGTKVDPMKDRIWVDGHNFVAVMGRSTTAILVNKPRQIIVTRRDDEGRPTVYELLPKEWHHLKPVGRLDFNSQGALILTDDGDLINKLTHPRYHLDKIYLVKLSSHPEPRQLERMRRGVIIDDVRTQPADITVDEKNATSTVLKFVLTEGRNRQIRKMCEAVGLMVKEIKRIQIGPVKLGRLRSGQYRLLSQREIKELKEASNPN